tara:strand:+ start:4839 stop:5714 length:876 start_codon:yes stop_codon:yes gene_type:complete
MKLVIPTYNRAETINTINLEVFKQYETYLLFHSEEQKLKYIYANDLTGLNLVVGVESSTDGTAKARNIEWFIDNYIDDGEWFIFADDNISSVAGLVDENMWQQEFINEVDKDWFGFYSPELFNTRIFELIDKAEDVNAHMIGFQTSKNYFYAHRKYRYRGYVIGKLYLWKKDKNFVWDKPFVPMEDFHISIMHLLNYGCVLLCDYMWANAKHYTAGGLGSKSHRRNNYAYGTEYLSKKYPDLVKPKKRDDNYPDLRFTTYSDKNFYKWLKVYEAFKKEYKFNEKTMRWDKK